MTAKKILLATLIMLAFNSSSAQITFQKTIGGTDYDYGYSVQQTTDGGYVIAGYTSGFGAGGGSDVYLIKTDAAGTPMWTKTFGGIGPDYGYSVQQTNDGGYIIGGVTYGFGAGNADVYLIKTDAIGSILWTKTYGRSANDYGYSVQQTDDGGYIIAGSTESFGAGLFDFYLIKTNSTGDTLWTKTFGGSNFDYGYFIQQTIDGGYIIEGPTKSFGAGGWDVYLIKTDTIGNILWAKTFGGIGNDYDYSVQQTSEGGYIMAGVTYNAGNYDVYLIKTDAIGDTLWTRMVGGFQFSINSVKQTTDGGYIISGIIASYEVCLIKTDTSGNTLWTKAFGGAVTDEGYSALQTTDGGYIITCKTQSFGAGGADVYLIKTDSLGNSGCNQTNPATIVTFPPTIVTNPATIMTSPATVVTTPVTIVGSGGTVNSICTTVGFPQISLQQTSISIYPNPFSSTITVNSTKGNGEIVLYDASGKEIFHQATLETETKLNTTEIESGFYILHYIEGNRVENIKVTKM
jgi:hypothetical protein